MSKALETLFIEDVYRYNLTDDEREFLAANGGLIAGGIFASLATNRPINDIDIYFSNAEQMIGFLEVAAGSRRIVHVTEKAVTLSPTRLGEIPIQVVIGKSYSTAKAIFKAFDFTVCMAVFDCSTKKLKVHKDFWFDNASRVLRFNPKTPHPISSLLRSEKYKGYGYTLSVYEQIRISLAISKLSIKTNQDIRDQIGGMYGDIFLKPEDDSTDTKSLLGGKPNTSPFIAGKIENDLSHAIQAIMKNEGHFVPDGYYVKSVKQQGETYHSSRSIGGVFEYIPGELLPSGGTKVYCDMSPVDHNSRYHETVILLKLEERIKPDEHDGIYGNVRVINPILPSAEWGDASAYERIRLVNAAIERYESALE